MGNYRITTKAKADLLHIGRTTRGTWGKKQRNKYLRELDDAFSFLADNPKAGIDCDEIMQGYLKHAKNSHIIFYKEGAQYSVEIIRILHKRMDAPRHLPQL